MPLTIIDIVIFLFGMTTLMGMYLSSLVLRSKESSKTTIIVHGIFTITGFVLLSFYYPASIKSILFFAVATCCGLILLFQDLTGRRFTKWLCYAHGILTIIGFVFLLMLRSK